MVQDENKSLYYTLKMVVEVMVKELMALTDTSRISNLKYWHIM